MHAPKAGHASDEYEDAAAVAADAWPVRAAVADGATESAFARRWAEQVAHGAVADAIATPEALHKALPAWRAAWQAEVDARADALPWYAAAKAADGAFATLLTCTLHADGTWHALSIGDCGLFQVRSGEAVIAWPLAEADAFHNRPDLLSSRPTSDTSGAPDTPPVQTPPVQTQTGTWTPGDAFVLATDAVAAWLLRTGPDAALTLTPDAFADAVASARASGTLRNDDATLVRLHLAPSSP